MNQLTEGHSIPTTMLAIHYLRVQLVRRPKPKDPADPNGPVSLIPECDAQTEKLTQANAQCEEVSIDRMAINADLQQLVQQNYKTLQQVNHDLYSLLKGDLKSPLYLQLFPKPLSKSVTNSNSYLQVIRYTNSVKRNLEEHAADYAALQKYVPEIQNNVDEIAKLLNKREQIIDQEQRVTSARGIILQEAKKFYNKAYVRLLMAYDNDRDLVEKFFYKVKKAPAKKKATGEDAGKAED